MATRPPGAMPPLTPAGVIDALLGRVRELETRLARLEGREGQQLPPDFRFRVSEDGSTVIIERVSTEGSAEIAGPM